jgi:hypothetical protein
MWKNKKFVISIVIAVALLFTTTGIALADNSGTSIKNKIIVRAAQILGISQDKLESALKQAAKEQGTTALDTMFQKWVDAGKLTQDQVNQYKTWLKARPDIPVPLRGLGIINKNADSYLQKLVDAGKITKDQADQYKKWLKSKPNIELPKPERPQKGASGK